MSVKLTKCKACGAEIAKNAKTCPQCGNKNKKPVYSKIWFWLIIVVAIIAVGSSNSGTNQSDVQETAQTNNVQENIEYTKYDVSTLIDDLESNALNAKSKYDKQYVEISGELTNIDSSGSYINVSSAKHEFSFLSA